MRVASLHVSFDVHVQIASRVLVLLPVQAGCLASAHLLNYPIPGLRISFLIRFVIFTLDIYCSTDHAG